MFKQHLQRIMAQDNKFSLCGVYKPYRSKYCSKFYIGQTDRVFRTRCFEHIRYIQIPDLSLEYKSSIIRNVVMNTNLQIIRIMRKSKKLNKTEKIEIADIT